MVFVDLALARRLEIASAWRGIEYARAVERLQPGVDVATEAVGGGYAVYAGAMFPGNRAIGQGLEGAVGSPVLHGIERFYQKRGAVPRVSVCPLADPSWPALLSSAGYRVERFFSVLAQPLSPNAVDLATSPDVQVSVGGSEDRDLWLRTVAEGFDGRDDASPDTVAVLAPNFDSAQATCYLAWIDGEPAGGGELFIHERVAELGSASTRPAFRRRGVHRALVDARLAAADAAACDLAMVLTSPGSDSQRNLECAGFCLAYTQVIVAEGKEASGARSK